MANPFEETLEAGTVNPWQQAAESMMQEGIGSLAGSGSPNYGNLPNKYKGFEGNTGEPIHNLSFNINKDAPNLKWIQEPMNKDAPGTKFYSGQPYGYMPPFVPKDPTGYKGDPLDILSYMDQLRDMGEMDFLGSMDQVFQMDDPSLFQNHPLIEEEILKTPGRKTEGTSQDYSHILDYYDYLNTLPVDQLQGIESIVDAARRNAARNKKWWAQSDI